MSLEKDCYDHVVFKREFFLIFHEATNGFSNLILLYKIIYYGILLVWSGGFVGLSIRAVFYCFFSCGHSGIRSNHIEIKSGRIPNRNIYMPITENSVPPCRAGPPARVHMKNIHLT